MHLRVTVQAIAEGRERREVVVRGSVDVALQTESLDRPGLEQATIGGTVGGMAGSAALQAIRVVLEEEGTALALMTSRAALVHQPAAENALPTAMGIMAVGALQRTVLQGVMVGKLKLRHLDAVTATTEHSLPLLLTRGGTVVSQKIMAIHTAHAVLLMGGGLPLSQGFMGTMTAETALALNRPCGNRDRPLLGTPRQVLFDPAVASRAALGRGPGQECSVARLEMSLDHAGVAALATGILARRLGLSSVNLGGLGLRMNRMATPTRGGLNRGVDCAPVESPQIVEMATNAAGCQLSQRRVVEVIDGPSRVVLLSVIASGPVAALAAKAIFIHKEHGVGTLLEALHLVGVAGFTSVGSDPFSSLLPDCGSLAHAPGPPEFGNALSDRLQRITPLLRRIGREAGSDEEQPDQENADRADRSQRFQNWTPRMRSISSRVKGRAPSCEASFQRLPSSSTIRSSCTLSMEIPRVTEAGRVPTATGVAIVLRS